MKKYNLVVYYGDSRDYLYVEADYFELQGGMICFYQNINKHQSSLISAYPINRTSIKLISKIKNE